MNDNERMLLQAAKDGDAKAIQAALSVGTNPNLRDCALATVLYWAAHGGPSEAEKAEIAAGNPPEIVNGEPIYTGGLIIDEEHVEVVITLLAAGADSNLSNRQGQVPLHCAAANGFEKTVKALLENGADPTIADKNASTPLHNAAFNADINVIKLLINTGANIQVVDKHGHTPLYGTPEWVAREAERLPRHAT